MGLKRNFSNHWFMVRLNLSSDNVRNCEKKLCSWKNAKKLLNVRREESSIWRISKEFYLKNPKSLLNLKKYIRKIE